jgi:uncharacterized RDD family membrane protein YckC
MATLKIILPDGTESQIDISGELITIGREPNNQVVIPDLSVSRQHALIERKVDGYYLEDRNSSYGTFVNGNRISRKMLADGDQIDIGEAKLQFQNHDPVFTMFGRGSSTVTYFEPPPVTLPPPIAEVVAVPGLCPSCRGAIREDNRFCPHCGHLLPASKAQPSAQPVEALKAAAFEELLPEAAGIFRRFMAAMTDLVLVIFVLSIPIAVTIYTFLNAVFLPIPRFEIVIAWLLLLVCQITMLTLFVVYHVYFVGKKGATPGKKLFGIKVCTPDGQSPVGYEKALLRTVSYFLDWLIAGIGFLMIVFDKQRRGLHDRLAGTIVVRSN